MTKQEIISALEAGAIITVKSFMKYKRGKLQRGVTRQYSVGDTVIRSSQFDAIEHLLTRDKSNDDVKKYSHETFYKLKTV